MGGPLLASPLSTSLSTMVQDLKRGNSVRRRESLLALGAGAGAGVRNVVERGDGGGEDGGVGMGMGLGGEPLSRRRTRDSAAGGEEGSRTPGGRRVGRGRSLSALSTLSGLWRGIRGQGSREDLREGEGRARAQVSMTWVPWVFVILRCWWARRRVAVPLRAGMGWFGGMACWWVVCWVVGWVRGGLARWVIRSGALVM